MRIIVEGRDKATGKIKTIVHYESNQEKRIQKAIERAERRGYEVEVRVREF